MLSRLILLCCLLSANIAFAQLSTVTYQDKDQKLNGQLIKPTQANTKKAGVLILPAWKGIDEHSKTVAQQLSKEGYYVFIADIYGEGNYPKTTADAGKMAGYYKKNLTAYHNHIRLALDQLIKAGASADEIVIIGYCFGGQGALEAARINMPVKGVVSIHGSYTRDTAQPIVPIKPHVLILHGADDPHNPPADIAALQDELRKAGADWQMNYYSNAVHAFTDPAAGNDNSKGAAYNEQADRRSWQALLVFLKETL
ncbi:MAG: dienelactone hydrolase family protein [Taibaiella sp.]|jgi:dienelactone hydrolase